MSLREKYTPQERKTTGLIVSDVEETKKERPVVLHVGITAPMYSSAGISNGWRQNGYDVSYFNWQQLRFDTGLDGLRERLIVKTITEKPDIVFLHVQQEGVIDIETAQELSKHSFVVNYTFDVRSHEKTEWMHELAPHIGLTVYACEDDFFNAVKLGLKNITHCHSSCDPDVFRKLNLPESITKGVPEIVFVGNNTVNSNLNFEEAKERLKMVEFLKQEYGDRFGVYGQGWGNGSKMIHNQDKVNIYNACKIAITQNQFFRTGYQSDRCWEILACGTFAAVQSYPGINDDLKDGENCAIWANLSQLKGVIDFFLENDTDREKVARNGSNSFTEAFQWRHRIAQILESAKKPA